MVLDVGITKEMLLVLSILLLTAFLFVFTYIRVDVVAVIILVLIGVTQLLPPEQLFLGFSSEAVIALISVMIISAGLENAGISNKVAKMLLRLGRAKPKKISFLLMIITGILASCMRSLGAVAIFLPIVIRIYARTGISKSYLLMPVAFCALLGGTLTMVGTGPLILLNSLLKSSYEYINEGSKVFYPYFELFEVFPIGVMLLAVGIVYVLIIRNKLTEKIIVNNIGDSSTRSNFKRTYGYGIDIFEIRVSDKSSLIGKTLKEVEQKLDKNSLIEKTLKDIEKKLDKSNAILALKKEKKMCFPPLKNEKFEANMHFAIIGNKEGIEKFSEKYDLILGKKLNHFEDLLHPIKAGLSEVVIPPRSQLIGTPIKELHMRYNYNLQVLALYRGNTVYKGEDLKNLDLKSGDTLGIYSNWDALGKFKKQRDRAIIITAFPREKIYPKKMPYALFFFALSLILVLFKIFPLSVGLLLGAVGMIATGVLSVDKAYNSVSWNTVFLIGGLLPLGLIMKTSGTANLIISLISSNNLLVSPLLTQIFLAVITTFLALFISNIGATVLLIPIAIELAINVGVSPKIFAIIVALSASNTFLLPTNGVTALVAGPGSYTNKDFLVYGGMMTVIFWVVMLFGVNLFF